jgi:hypothetical protein
MQQPFDRLIAPVPPGPARTLLLGLSGYVTDRPDALVVRDVVPLFGYFLQGGHYRSAARARSRNASRAGSSRTAARCGSARR